MALQRTPPLGWPHTEAARYADGDTRAIIERTQPAPPGKKGCGCGRVLVFFMVLLAVLGVAVAVVIWAVESDKSTATDVFISSHPGWYEETSDIPDGAGDTVRLVVWNDDLYVGRIVMMDPVERESGWQEQQLIVGVESAWEEEALLAAFSRQYRDTSYSYIMEATPVSTEGSEQVWKVSYRIWYDGGAEWSETLYAEAVRYANDGTWDIAGPDESVEGTSNSTTP